MSGTPTSPATGARQVRGDYDCDEGARQLVAQRINGRVALSDVPASDQGKVYLIECHLHCMDELEGLEADYLALAARLGRPPLRSDWIFE
jgi:hypothetical protein